MTDSNDEVWRTIPNWTNYKVSNLGRVKRIACWSDNNYRWLKERMVTIFKDSTRGAARKYVFVYVNLGTLANHKTVSVARLVLLAFVGAPKPGQECRHLDDNSENCILSNLAWGTRDENRVDAILNKRLATGERNGCAKLTKRAVLAIRRDYKPYSKTFGSVSLAKKYEVQPSTILDIVYKVTWKHV